MWVQSLGQEDPCEKEMATHSSKLAWEITWTEEPGRLQSMGQQRVRHDLVMKQQQAGAGSYGIFVFFFFFLAFIYLFGCTRS